MFFRLFNWLVNRVPYASAVMIPSLIWAGFVVGVFVTILISNRADFESTGTRGVFIAIMVISVVSTYLITNIRVGFFRFLGKPFGGVKVAQILNKNIIKGHIRFDVSNQALSEILPALREISIFLIVQAVQCMLIMIAFCSVAEYLFSGYQLKNIPIIIAVGVISMFMVIIWAAVSYELFTSPCRRECKKLLLTRNIFFQEKPLLNLSLKFKLFPLLLGPIFIIVLLLVEIFTWGLAFILAASLMIFWVLSESIFFSIFKDFKEIEESAKNLKQGKEVLSFFGSSDKELLNLSNILNETARDIGKYQEGLREAKEVAEKRLVELERWYNLTVGRELKMVELKKKIKDLEKLEEKK